MRDASLPFEVSASSFLPSPFNNLLRPMDPALMRWIFPLRLRNCMPDPAERGLTATGYARQLLANLDIRFNIDKQDLANIPAKGGVVVVSNHPFGFLEGLILLNLLEEIRPDYRIVANGLLASVPPLQERLIFVDAFAGGGGATKNSAALRSSIEWIRAGGLLLFFPAGEVSHLNWAERPVADPEWNTTAARIARKSGCATVPLFFQGSNSGKFQMVGALHPSLRTLNLANELANKRSRTVTIRAGTPIPSRVLNTYPDAETATQYLRARTYLLGSRPANRLHPKLFENVRSVRRQPIGPPSSGQILQKELAALPADRILARNDDFAVYLASSGEIPYTLSEIGRCREVTYRAIGEGTGKARDLDEFDEYYSHIVLWHFGERRVAGAYRLAATPDVLSRRGLKGLYSSTLFHYDREFFDRLGPALELGRSFICADYQKRYSPLLLLWKGILRYVVRRPECAVLFGAVSVSSDYETLSRTLIVNFLSGHVANNASQMVRPKLPFQSRALVPKHIKQLGRLLPTVEELSSSIQDLEADHKGLPILIKQYLKIGGELLGFNIDPHFSNVLDVLVMADLRTASGPLLERCLGQAGAATFRTWHSTLQLQ